MFYPGETDLHKFTLPFASSAVSSVKVSYKQKGKVVLEKTTSTIESLGASACRISISLTQTDTMKFVDDQDIYIQLNVTNGNNRVTSDPIKVKCGEQYHRSVI